jgi:hypothetical protein
MKKTHLGNFFAHLNNLSNDLKDIKFTKETENPSGCLPFLDLNLQRIGDRIETSIYRKPTHSNRYLNFRSYHALEYKKSVIRTLINRIFSHISNPQLMQLELEHLKDILENNNYPISLIQSIYDKLNQHEISEKDVDTKLDPSKIISIPYIKGTSEQIRNLMTKDDFKIVYSKGQNIKSLLCQRNARSLMDKNNVVYRVNCNDCTSTYTGNTKRKLAQRLGEHKKALEKNYIQSHIAEHALENNHSIDWDNVEVLQNENNYMKRYFLEKFEIEKQKYNNKPVMNKQCQSETCIPPQYIPLLNKLN